ncbi:MAG TPA: hypothetical protein VMM17_03990 [Gemmatimonadaceae bacterium]|nr:hypothetical protein [Gemmatimonadaceae bacterium]
MPTVDFADLPDLARVWVFASSRPLSEAEERELLSGVDAFLKEWRAHGEPLAAARDWREHRFLTIGVDQRAAHASGCSIDGLYRVLKEFERTVGAGLLGGGMVHYRVASGEIRTLQRDDFAESGERGDVTRDTTVFDLTVSTVREWLTGFEKPAGRSWHSQLLPAAHSV